MYRLIVSDGLKMREEYPLEEQITIIGRDEDKCHIFLDSQRVSRQHLRIILKSNKVYVEDLGSSNGISLNEEKIDKIQQLSEDDVIHFGEFYAQLNNTNKIKRSYQIDELLSQKKKAYEKLHEKPYFRLVSEDKRYPGLSFEIPEGVTTVGRTKVSNIVIPSKSLSKKHLQFKRNDTQLLIEDLKSINGTFVNSRKVRKPIYLKNNDEVLLGDLEFVIKTNIEAMVPKRKVNLIPILIGAAIIVPILLMLPTLFKDPPKSTDKIDPTIELQKKQRARALRINQRFGDAKQLGTTAKWHDALRNLKALLDEDPSNAQAIKMRTKYTQELELQKRFIDAKQAFDILDYKLCRNLLSDIPNDSYYSQYSKVLRDKATVELIKTYFVDAKTFHRAKHFKSAYEALRSLFKLTSHHPDARKLKFKIEQDARRYRSIKLVFFKIEDISIKTIAVNNAKQDKINKLKLKYPDHETFTAIKHFVSGNLTYVFKFLNKIGAGKKNYHKVQALKNSLHKFKTEQSRGNQMLRRKDYNAAEKYFKAALLIEKKLLEGTGVESRYAKQMRQQLSQSFNDVGRNSWKNGRFSMAYRHFRKSQSYDPQNSKNLEDLSRTRKRAQLLWEQSLSLERQGNSAAFQKWKEVIGITDPKTSLHQNAQKKLSQQ